MKFGFRRKKKEMPDGLWMKCRGCSQMVYRKEVEENFQVCPKCDLYYPMTAPERIKLLLDPGSFEERFEGLKPTDPLKFNAGGKAYAEKLVEEQKKTGLKDAVIAGEGTMNGHPLAFGCTDSRFLMGSMGSVLGEKITRLIELAHARRVPLVIVSGSGGGARMQEAPLSLMQMVKTSAAIGRFQEAGGFFVSVLTNPTMGGVMASYATLGDVLVAEPKALLGFAGPRVIQQTIRQELPEGFQSSEFMLEHGMIDMIAERKSLKETLTKLIEYCRVES